MLHSNEQYIYFYYTVKEEVEENFIRRISFHYTIYIYPSIIITII